ncbi:DUF6207 family protein [Streptomyces sp. NPDC002324]
MSEPCLVVVVDVAAADDDTALAFQQLLAERWATATTERMTRDAGGPASGGAATWTCTSHSIHKRLPPTLLQLLLPDAAGGNLGSRASVHDPGLGASQSSWTIGCRW